ncbi:salutaridinol 7-O-acetyltransferase-like [Rhodamnia argentea]|uniref:Salutaridinol 7-O-acetyltransferase-like n=1 Tax=Rhodamnia argentea TaxID=178133 RepID=A0ABM3GYM3_9MYRT|nr:salutaridinol 7-O-acetyltransferase-like [Rhodamnia argentea]
MADDRCQNRGEGHDRLLDPGVGLHDTWPLGSDQEDVHRVFLRHRISGEGYGPMPSPSLKIELKVKVVATKTIRPPSPTPDHLKNLKLSVSDQLPPILYTSNTSASSPHRSRRLKASLSGVLARFYPLAGRIRDNLYMDGDGRGGGTEFVQAEVNCPLSHVLEHPRQDLLHKLLPIDTESPEVSTGRLLLVQANTFGCGHLAIGVCSSEGF